MPVRVQCTLTGRDVMEDAQDILNYRGILAEQRCKATAASSDHLVAPPPEDEERPTARPRNEVLAEEAPPPPPTE